MPRLKAKELYRHYYSMSRLRQLAQRVIGGHHSDLYEGLKVAMLGLGRKEGLPELGAAGSGRRFVVNKVYTGFTNELLPIAICYRLSRHWPLL